MTDLVAAATAYLNAGLSVIALVGKKPNTDWHPNGLSDPMSGAPNGPEDELLLQRVFGSGRTTGIGLLIPDGVLVADVDTEEAAQTLLDLSGGNYPDTVAAKTRNGLHLWFLDPNGTNQSIWVGNKTLLFRGPGSYVAAPPSAHPDGGHYEWLRSIHDVGIQPLPAGVSDAIRTVNLLAETKTRTFNSYRWQLRHENGTWSMTCEAVDADIAPLAKTVQNAPIGQRNSILAWASMTAAEEGITLEEALPVLTEAALAAGLEPRETRTTIRQAYRRKGVR